MINLFFIAVIIVFIVDVSGFIDNAKQNIFRWIHGNKIGYREFTIKPFDCSLCLTWWAGLIYLFYTGNLEIFTIFILVIIVWATPIIKQLFIALRDIAGVLVNKLTDFTNKINE